MRIHTHHTGYSTIPVVQPSQIATTQPTTVIAKVQQPSQPPSVSAQPASFLVVDDTTAWDFQTADVHFESGKAS